MKQEKTNVVVVAAGLSGLAATISAAESGVGVIAFEKANTTGGAANMGMGPLGVGSRLQREKLVSITPGEAFRKHMNFTHWRVDARMVREFYFRSGETIDWLEDMGVEFLSVQRAYAAPEVLKPYATSEETWHVVRPSDGSNIAGPRAAGAMIKVMTDRALELGADIRLNTKVIEILKEGDKVVGVIAEDANGEKTEVRADAVIIATGGAGDNAAMIKENTGYDWGDNLFSFRVPGMDGEGMKMAWNVGAGKTPISLELMYTCPHNMETPNHFIMDGAFRQPCLWVNSLGERFMNEDSISNTTFAGNAIATQPGKMAYSIFDSALLKRYKKKGPDITSHVHPFDLYEQFDDAIQGILDAGYEHVFIAETLEELAEKTGINEEALLNTVDEYNELCDNGFDELFEKDHQFLQPIEKGPFYACRYFPSAYGTLGGIRINHRTEVMTEDHKVIPGLYAVGVDACAIYADCYPFILPGNTMGFCLTTGRMAGENAAQHSMQV
ncbi:MAG: FAD-dependent oxidoreductase [Anaerovoracaceae bacterium]|jgi:fumarate reductase flavoprotein subunit